MSPDPSLASEDPRLSPAAPAFALARAGTHAARILLAAEFLLLFIAIPLALFFRVATHIPPMPLLWAVALYCLIVLLRDPSFDRRALWNLAPLRSRLPQILSLFAVGVLLIGVLVRLCARGLIFTMVRVHPGLWAMLMVGYPLFSVYPQGLIYRAFIFHRYEPLLETAFSDARTRSAMLIFASGATFALMHIVFRNWIALALTLPGGILFAVRYENTRSLAVSSLEHALYGCFLFTIGLGQFFCVRVV
ncbi:MAG: CPBP family intramembrane glutamic endopeptidase [Acidobacteriota bacterium]